MAPPWTIPCWAPNSPDFPPVSPAHVFSCWVAPWRPFDCAWYAPHRWIHSAHSDAQLVQPPDLRSLDDTPRSIILHERLYIKQAAPQHWKPQLLHISRTRDYRIALWMRQLPATRHPLLRLECYPGDGTAAASKFQVRIYESNNFGWKTQNVSRHSTTQPGSEGLKPEFVPLVIGDVSHGDVACSIMLLTQMTTCSKSCLTRLGDPQAPLLGRIPCQLV